MLKKLSTPWQIAIHIILLVCLAICYILTYSFLFIDKFDTNVAGKNAPDFNVNGYGITLTDDKGRQEVVFPKDRDLGIEDDGAGHYKLNKDGNKERILPEIPKNDVPQDLQQDLLKQLNR
jgi:hypothetical protein